MTKKPYVWILGGRTITLSAAEGMRRFGAKIKQTDKEFETLQRASQKIMDKCTKIKEGKTYAKLTK